MELGSAIDGAGQYAIRRTAEQAYRSTGYVFDVVVADSGEDHRAFACVKHAALADPDRSVLLMVDPDARAFEIVTGVVVHRVLDDAGAALAAVGMQSWFAEGDLVDGIVHGLQQLADRANVPETLHADQL